MSRAWKITAVLLLALAASAEESVRQLYERARLLQERNRRLEEAIRIYSRVVELAKDNRSLAARALLEQGVLYLRLGRDEEAREAFRKVVRDFPEQMLMVREARARLGVNGDGKVLRTRQVWTNPDADPIGGPSPDGRYLSFVDPTTGDLSIRDLTTGESRRITRKTAASTHSRAMYSVFSPDSKRIAYWWIDEDGSNQVRVAGLDGSALRVLRRFEDSTLIRLTDWSPDGKSILAEVEYRSAPAQITLIAASDGSLRALHRADVWPGRMSFSRDGKFILHDGRGSPGADVYLLAVDTGQDVPLAPHPAEEFAIGWSPDGDQILFGSDRTGTLSLWTLTVRNGQAQGEPRLVRADAGSIEPLGVTRSGAFYYWVSSGLVDIYTAAIDPERAAILEAPKPVPTRFVGSNRSPDWSRDGKYLLYQSTRPGNELVIVIRSLESGVERDLRTLPALRFSTPRWNATGDAILASGTLAGKKGIYRIDPQKGAAALAVEMPPDKLLFTPDWSGDGQTLYGRFDNFNGVQRMDVPTRTIRPLYNPADAPGPFAANDTGPSDPLLSPDGRELLFQQRDRPRSDNLLIVTPEGGAPRVLLQGRWPDQAFPKGSYAWTPDSRWILVVQRSSGQAEILVVPAQGGELRRTGIHMSEIQSLRAAPDGHHIVFEGGQAGGAVWVAENLF